MARDGDSTSIPLLAALCLKNSVNRLWRPRRDTQCATRKEDPPLACLNRTNPEPRLPELEPGNAGACRTRKRPTCATGCLGWWLLVIARLHSKLRWLSPALLESMFPCTGTPPAPELEPSRGPSSLVLPGPTASVQRKKCQHCRPALFPTLVSQLQSPDQLTSTRAHLTLHHVVKVPFARVSSKFAIALITLSLQELSTKRLANDQRILAEVHFPAILMRTQLLATAVAPALARHSHSETTQITTQLFDAVWSTWCRDTQALADGAIRLLAARRLSPILSEMHGELLLLLPVPADLQQILSGAIGEAQLALGLERWLLELKVLRRCVLHSAPSDARCLSPAPLVERAAPAIASALVGLVPFLAALATRCVLASLSLNTWLIRTNCCAWQLCGGTLALRG